MNDRYYFADSDKNPQGPYDLFQLEGMIDGGLIDRDTLVIREGSDEWVPLRKIQAGRAASVPASPSGGEDRPHARIPDSARKYLFIAPVLRMISEGRLFNRVFAVTTKLGAVIFAIAMIVVWFKAWGVISDICKYGESGGIIIGGILLQIVFLIGIYMITHVQWIRANEIGAQPPSEFTIIPIFAISLRMAGEVSACASMVLGAGGFLLILFAGSKGGYLLRMVGSGIPGFGTSLSAGEGTFLSALGFLLINAMSAFLSLVLFYLLAEVIIVIVDMAKNIRTIRERLEASESKAQPTAKQ